MLKTYKTVYNFLDYINAKMLIMAAGRAAGSNERPFEAGNRA